ncbi:MT-A70-domain-containing protein [Irpex rosettiformis]|uniref:MT-A70-domain-containing protein n=1 Tax=Irpex rosettiformis TaxID=378272 RepID=A0ACB8UJG9_9APHY|nr:MT-A70-domain-containing protein [Irpex rosettiformis]
MLTTAECISSANDLLAAHAALVNRVRLEQKSYRRQLRALPSPPQSILNVPLIPSPQPSPPQSRSPSPSLPPLKQRTHKDLSAVKRARVARYDNYVPEEETIRNDYSQRYVDGGEWPQNWVLGAEPEHRFEEYPKQQRLLALKKASVAENALPATWLPYSELATVHPSKFDVVLIDPPFSSSFSWDDLQELPIPALAADPSFVFMWVGSGAGEGLERGREVMAKWGFRRCEDIVWVKTNNTTNRGPGTDPPTTSLLTRTKQHCLMGIRGTVRRSTDSWFVHCNVDTDVLIWEGDSTDPTLKPPEMYTLIENFCLGLRRLELFGRARSLRRGWVSALAEGEELSIGAAQGGDVAMEGDETPVRWEREVWEAKMREFAVHTGGKCVVPMTSEIDALRPKSPVRGGSNNQSHHVPNPSMGNQPSGMAVPMAAVMGPPRHTNNFNPPPRMMGPPIMMGGMNPMVGMGGEGLGMPMQNMPWAEGGVGMTPMGVPGMGMSGMAQPMAMSGMGGMGGMGGLGNLNQLGNLANFNNMNQMGGMGMGTVHQFGGGGQGFDGSNMQGMGGWEGQDMMGMGIGGIGGMGGIGIGGGIGMSGMNNAMGLNGMNNMMGGQMNMPMGGMGMNAGMGMNNAMGGMGMSQWRQR